MKEAIWPKINIRNDLITRKRENANRKIASQILRLFRAKGVSFKDYKEIAQHIEMLYVKGLNIKNMTAGVRAPAVMIKGRRQYGEIYMQI